MLPLILVLSLFSLSLGAPVVTVTDDYACDKVFVEYNFTNSDSSYYPYYISFTMTASVVDKSTYVTVTNLTFVSQHDVNIMCSVVQANTTIFKSMKTKDFQFLVGNSSFALYVDVTGTEPFIYPISMVISSVADESGFSMVNGEMFNKTQACSNNLFNDNQKDYGKQCCTSFKAVPSVSTTNYSPCVEFTSTTTIYQTNNSYSLFATDRITYTIANNQIQMKAILKETGSGYAAIYYVNGQSRGYSDGDYPFQKSIPIPSSNSKFLFMISDDFGIHLGNIYIPVSRIQFRNGIAMIDEKTPFTPKNNCQYLPNYVLSYKSMVVTTQLCCTKFQ